MPLDPAAERILHMMAVAKAPPGPRNIAVRREVLATLMRFSKALGMSPPGQDMRLACDVPVRVYHPQFARPASPVPAMIFFHGGGLVAGSLETHDVVCRGLCAASQCCVIAVDYRLAPEHPYPAALEDAVAATLEIKQRASDFAVDPARLALTGESGGAVLAIGAAHKLGPGATALLCLICPPVDFSMASPSWRAFGNGYLLDRETLEADLADVTQKLIAATDPRLSPIYLTGLARLPRTIVHTAEFDPLRDEGAAFCVLLRAAGVKVTHHLHQGLLHGFHAMGAVVPRGAEALKEMGAEIGAVLQAGAA